MSNSINGPISWLERKRNRTQTVGILCSCWPYLGNFSHLCISAVLSGVTVFLCGLAIALLGSHCHSPTVLLANFVATPIELSLVVPFLRLGEAICGGPHFSLTSDALKQVLTGQASRTLLLSVVHALLGWLVAAPFIMSLLYVILLPCFKLLVRKFSSVPSSSSPKMHIHPEVKPKLPSFAGQQESMEMDSTT